MISITNDNREPRAKIKDLKDGATIMFDNKYWIVSNYYPYDSLRSCVDLLSGTLKNFSNELLVHVIKLECEIV